MSELYSDVEFQNPEHFCFLPVLEIATGHWSFSNQFRHLADQNPFWLAKFTVHFQWNMVINNLIFKKMADQYLKLISSTTYTYVLYSGKNQMRSTLIFANINVSRSHNL